MLSVELPEQRRRNARAPSRLWRQRRNQETFSAPSGAARRYRFFFLRIEISGDIATGVFLFSRMYRAPLLLLALSVLHLPLPIGRSARRRGREPGGPRGF